MKIKMENKQITNELNKKVKIMSKSINKMGPAVVSESGEYETVKAMGPLTINAPAITANNIKAMGPANFVDSTVEAENMKIQGPISGSGKLTIGDFHVNGPIKFSGEVIINEICKINGPVNLQGNFSGNSEVDVKINGPLNIQDIKDFKNVKINGPVQADSLTNITTLKINGKVQAEEISVSEGLVISLNSGESVIGKITGGRIEIGQDTKEGFFKNFFIKLNKPGTAVIDEIISDGTVELDHVNVKKVTARELFAGDDTEIGEYIEIQD